MGSGYGFGERYRSYAIGIVLALCAAALAWSFWASSSWLQLCAGIALFLFGMQCLEEGLRILAGERLERMLARGTSTPLKSMLVGLGGTALLQSSTLVSLMTIAFITTGLIGLSAGIAIILGANLGGTTGIWLLALAGQNFSLSPFALPVLVFGVLGSFLGRTAKGAGRVLLGIAFIFLGIDLIKDGFSTVTNSMDLTSYQMGGWMGRLVFAGFGLIITMVLQSSHATLMLTLTALGLGQVDLEQAAAIAIGANVGSSVTTGLAGALGGNRAGQRLALAHVLFNVVTAVLAFVLLTPLLWLTKTVTGVIGFDDNALMMLAVFHTIFNGMGVLLFWPALDVFARLLERILPERVEPAVLIPGGVQLQAGMERTEVQQTRARYLNNRALSSLNTAARAVERELQHLGRLSLEVISHALYIPPADLERVESDDTLVTARPPADYLKAKVLYQRHIKGVYGDLLTFMGRVDISGDEEHRSFWTACQLSALQLVEAVKDAKHLQKNLRFYLRQPESPARDAYVALRRYMALMLNDIRKMGAGNLSDEAWDGALEQLGERHSAFDTRFRAELFAAVRNDSINGMQLSSLLNDLGYAGRIIHSLRTVLQLRPGSDKKMLRVLLHDDDDEPLIVLPGQVPANPAGGLPQAP